jgi:hypothetical protein
MYAPGRLAVGADAASLATAVLSPRLATLAWPFGSMSRLITLHWLPAPIRAAYGFRWRAADERRARLAIKTIARGRQWLPRRAACWPEAGS